MKSKKFDLSNRLQTRQNVSQYHGSRKSVNCYLKVDKTNIFLFQILAFDTFFKRQSTLLYPLLKIKIFKFVTRLTEKMKFYKDLALISYKQYIRREEKKSVKQRRGTFLKHDTNALERHSDY